jgi:hypothetical protein
MSTQADLLLAEMRSHIGMRGRPNVATRWYAAGHGNEYLDVAWCDMFLSYAAKKAGVAGLVGEFALCQAHLNWFKRMGLVDMKPAKGAIVFFDWDDDNVADHIGAVEALNADGSFKTIEGNTSDQVARRVRYMRDVQAFAHPAYLPAPPAYPGMLILGSRGEAVKLVQKRLVKLGYPLARYGADGIFGVETVREVKAFQRVERSKNPKVEIDGRVGPVTWRLLFP